MASTLHWARWLLPNTLISMSNTDRTMTVAWHNISILVALYLGHSNDGQYKYWTWILKIWSWVFGVKGSTKHFNKGTANGRLRGVACLTTHKYSRKALYSYNNYTSDPIRCSRKLFYLTSSLHLLNEAHHNFWSVSVGELVLVHYGRRRFGSY